LASEQPAKNRAENKQRHAGDQDVSSFRLHGIQIQIRVDGLADAFVDQLLAFGRKTFRWEFVTTSDTASIVSQIASALSDFD
jgi:hypothetical protein